MPRKHADASAIADAAPLFAALGDATRLGVVTRLCLAGPLSATRLSETANVSRQAVAKHLRVLADAGLVRSVREGREVVWELERRRLARARTLLEGISKDWDDTLERLRAFVEDGAER